MGSTRATAMVLALALLAPGAAWAQRTVHWQIEPAGFPGKTAVFVDVEESGVFRRDLGADAFELSVDEFVGAQGGSIQAPEKVAAGVGASGSSLLIVVDRSKTYAASFAQARKAATDLVGWLDAARDRIALATTPADDGIRDLQPEVGFTNDRAMLLAGIDRLSPTATEPARLCHALADAVDALPSEATGRYRAIVLLTAGVDRSDGEGGCVEASLAAGRVPFFVFTFSPDRAFDDRDAASRVEAQIDQLASKTGGRSIFRRRPDAVFQSVSQLWFRLRNQVRLEVAFPCYRPAPETQHLAGLKVEGRDAERIAFEAPSALAPVPTVTAIEPALVTRRQIRDGAAATISGSGFCGEPGTVRAFVGDRQVAVKAHTATSAEIDLDGLVEGGDVKVANQFGRTSEVPSVKMLVEGTSRGQDASAALLAIVLAIVVLAAVGVLVPALRRRRARIDPAAHAHAQAQAQVHAHAREKPSGPDPAALATVRNLPIARAWVRRSDGRTAALGEGVNMIGRDRACAVQLDLPGVSREHARLELVAAQGFLWLEDLGSTNGTLVERPAGSPAVKAEGRVMLSDGDVVSIAGERMAVHFERGAGGQ
jgi:hypothetical protein